MWSGSTDRARQHAFLKAAILAVAGLLPALAAAADPRIPMVEQQVERNHREALRMVERELAENPEVARRLGLDYLRGHLLLLLDRQQEALQAFVTTMAVTPQLSAYSRYRMALEQEALGHPEVAAGLVATLLGSRPPRALVPPAMRLLERTLSLGGDCRLVRGLARLRFATPERRRLALVRAACAQRQDEPAQAYRMRLELLEEKRDDSVARSAALAIAAVEPEKKRPRTHLLLGLAFYHHREFDAAIRHLARALVQLPTATDITSQEAFECRYNLARSHFWQGRYEAAAIAFGSLAETTLSPTRKAQALYQRARSFELLGDWERAIPAFRQAYRADPAGRWGDAALISRLRLEWQSGRQAEALAVYETLRGKRKPDTTARALLFLASSELASGRPGQAENWLAAAARLGKVSEQELGYWRGRFAETSKRPAAAVRLYLQVLARNPYHPFGDAARRRLAQEELALVARAAAIELASASRPDDLYASWLLLGDGHPSGRRAWEKLAASLASDQAAAPFLRLDRVPTERWPLWQAHLRRPEEMLLALGIFEEGSSMVLRHFPVAEPGLAFTGSLVLARSGETRHSVRIAEILAKRIPDQVPPQQLPTSYRQLLFPLSYGYLILREAGQRSVDPYLLAAIVREESRFDPRAFSGASARGLTQFVYPTARRVAERIELGPITPLDLENPETSIALGAAYLEELAQLFDGSLPEVVAAYNAGEPQAALWRRYCNSSETEEYLTKVAFRETRGYLAKVLTSRAHYSELYTPAEAEARE